MAMSWCLRETRAVVFEAVRRGEWPATDPHCGPRYNVLLGMEVAALGDQDDDGKRWDNWLRTNCFLHPEMGAGWRAACYFQSEQ